MHFPHSLHFCMCCHTHSCFDIAKRLKTGNSMISKDESVVSTSVLKTLKIIFKVLSSLPLNRILVFYETKHNFKIDFDHRCF